MQTRKILGFVLAGALALALLENLQGFVRMRGIGKPWDWSRGILDSLAGWVVVALLTPLVVQLARRFRLQRGLLARHIAIHSAAGFLFAVTAAITAGMIIAVRYRDMPFLFMVGKVATLYTAYYFAVYWAIAAAVHAIDRHTAAAEMEEKLTRERLEVLRAKLNPHFLFNTLNAISTMALQRDSEGVVQSLALVGDLLRVSLDDSLPQEIPLRRELELTDKYLAVQHLRFGDRLRVERDVDPAAHELLVPAMLLQPLVENAIVHGVGTVPGEGRVRIAADVDDGRLRIIVSDSGPGFTRNSRNGIGLASTRERLAALYGAAYVLEVGTADGGGAFVCVMMPRRAAT